MRGRGFSLSTRITFWVLLSVLAGGLLWMGKDVEHDQEIYLRDRSADLDAALQVEQAHIKQAIETLRQDTLFLANVPPISGIVRASTNDGFDARDKNSYATWETRLQEIFSAYLRAHPEYLQARYIGAAGEGRELVRVVNNNGRVEVIAREALQNRGDQDYFRAGLMLTVGRVHLSEFALSRDHGTIDEPHKPVLRAVTTVFDASGRVFGMVVLNRDVNSLFASASEGLPPGLLNYVADQQGHYLLHPDAKRAFAFEFGGKDNITDDFPLLKPLFEAQSSQNEFHHKTVQDGSGDYLAAKRVYFDASDPSRFLLVVNDLPVKIDANGLSSLSRVDLAETALAMLLISGLFLLMLRYTFAPLKRITAAAKEIAAGNRELRLTESGKAEIGELATALNVMLDRLSDRDLIEREREFRQKITETARDGYWLVDALGYLREANQAYADLSGYTIDELVGMHISQLEAKEESAEEVAAHMVKIVDEGSDVFETRHRHKDGHEIDIEVSTVYMPDTQNFVVFSHDITQRKKAESQMQRYKVVVETTMDGFWVADLHGVLEEVNEAYARMTGYTVEELKGMRISELEAVASPEDVLDHIDKLVLQGHDRFETKHKRKDGSAFDIEVSVTFMPKNERLFVFCRDISERNKALEVMQRHKKVIETTLDGFWMTDLHGFLEEVNESYARMSGYSRQELIGMHISDLEASERPEDVKAHIDKLMLVGYDRFETKHRRKDGQIVDIEISTTYMPESNKFFVFSHNITRRKQAEQELRVAAAAFETHEAILITDPQANIIRVNKAFTEITGYSAEEVIGRNPRIMSSGRQDHAFYADMWQQLTGTGSWAGEIWDRRKSGEIYPKWMSITAVKNEQGETTQYVAVFSDITERKKAEEEIRSLAFYDALTQLPNRRLFMERLHTALAASARYIDYGALLFLDLDRFKVLNDTCGHDYGDMLLVAVAARIRSCIREIDTVARFGGDEFVVLLESISSDRYDAAHKAGVVAEKIRDALSQPYQLKGYEHSSSPSIGITLYHGGGETMDGLLKHADIAMYQAKEAGRNSVRFYDPDLQKDWESTSSQRSPENADYDKWLWNL